MILEQKATATETTPIHQKRQLETFFQRKKNDSRSFNQQQPAEHNLKNKNNKEPDAHTH